jgi:hypothetical protein
VHSAHTYYLVRAHPPGSNKIKCGVHCPPSVFFFFYWRILAKSRPEKCDFDQNKGFFMGKMVSKFAKFQKEK